MKKYIPTIKASERESIGNSRENSYKTEQTAELSDKVKQKCLDFLAQDLRHKRIEDIAGKMDYLRSMGIMLNEDKGLDKTSRDYKNAQKIVDMTFNKLTKFYIDKINGR